MFFPSLGLFTGGFSGCPVETRLLMRNQLLLLLQLTLVSSHQGQRLHLCIYEAALSSAVAHSFPLSAHKSSGAAGIEQRRG